MFSRPFSMFLSIPKQANVGGSSMSHQPVNVTKMPLQHIIDRWFNKIQNEFRTVLKQSSALNCY